jgi:hypothetical protein
MPKLPFKVEVKLPFKPLHVERKENQEEEAQKKAQAEFEPIQEAWSSAIKQIARKNIQNGFEYQRIEWINRFKKPKYEDFGEYTREEATLESWEQHLYENPRDLENQGISQKKNPKTGYKYYTTGDALIDDLEKQFSEGKVPDLDKAFGHIKNGADFFRTYYGGKISTDVAFKQVKKDASGEKISEAGTRVEVDNYKKSDEWLSEALSDDPVLKKMAEKLGRPQ